MARENEVSADPFYSESNMKALDESFKQYEQGLTVIKTIEELKTMEKETGM